MDIVKYSKAFWNYIKNNNRKKKLYKLYYSFLTFYKISICIQKCERFKFQSVFFMKRSQDLRLQKF